MKNYGEAFRYLRKNKGIKLKELAEEGLSVSLIAQFEKGQSKISYDRLLKLLHKLNVSHDEFGLLVNPGQYWLKEQEMMSEFYQLMNSYQIDTVIDDFLLKLLVEQRKIEDYLAKQVSLKMSHFLMFVKIYVLFIKLKQTGKPMSLEVIPEDIGVIGLPVQQYLFDVEIWGLYELELLNRMSFIFTPPILWRFVQQSVKRSESYRCLPAAEELVFQTLFTCLTVFCAKNAFEYAFKTLLMVEEQLVFQENLRFAAMLPFYRGWIYFFMGDQSKANSLFLETIQIYEQLGLEKERDKYKELSGNLKKVKENQLFLIQIFGSV